MQLTPYAVCILNVVYIMLVYDGLRMLLKAAMLLISKIMILLPLLVFLSPTGVEPGTLRYIPRNCRGSVDIHITDGITVRVSQSVSHLENRYFIIIISERR